MKYCNHCGAEVSEEATFCPKCGGSLAADPLVENNVAVSDKDWLATFFALLVPGRFRRSQVLRWENRVRYRYDSDAGRFGNLELH